MSFIAKTPYKGCRDFFPTQKREQDYLFAKMHNTASLYAYEHYDGPLLEPVDLYMAKSGEELINEQIYSFTDRGKRFVAIRPEMTPTVARMVAQIHKESPKPIRWYSIPNLMRYEKPQKGRLREHWQFNVDIFGAPEILGEYEILSLGKDLLKSFGANSSHFSILINDRHIVDELFQKLSVDQETSYKLYKVIDKAKKVDADKLDQMISEHLSGDKKKLLKDYLNLKSFKDVFHLFEKSSYLEGLVEQAKQSELIDFLEYDPTIVRGLDYYTGIVFEIFDKHPDNRRAICGGGAYANLLQVFNESPLPGVGFGLGDVTLLDFLKTHKLIPDFSKPNTRIIVTYQSEQAKKLACKTANEFRNTGISTELLMGATKPKKVFQISEKKGHQFAVFIGEDELSKNQFKLKNLQERSEETYSINDISEEWINKVIGNGSRN